MFQTFNRFDCVFQVPAGTTKKELLEHLDKVPTYVQQLQFTVKEPTVGRAATFSKVDNVIQETKHLMNVISKVVTTCFDCANKVILFIRYFYLCYLITNLRATHGTILSLEIFLG